MAEEVCEKRRASKGENDEEDDGEPAGDGELVSFEHTPHRLPVAERMNLVLVLLSAEGLRPSDVGDGARLDCAHLFTTSSRTRGPGPYSNLWALQNQSAHREATSWSWGSEASSAEPSCRRANAIGREPSP